MTEPTVTDPVLNGFGFDVTVSDGERTHRVWVPLRSGDDEWMYELAVGKWRAAVEHAEKAKAAQYQPGCAKGAGGP